MAENKTPIKVPAKETPDASQKDNDAIQAVQSFASKLQTCQIMMQELGATAKGMLDTLLPLMDAKNKVIKKLETENKEQKEIIATMAKEAKKTK